MYSQTTTSTTLSSDSSQTDSRLTVADILSSMASGGEPITPASLPSFEGNYSTGVLTQTTPTLTPTTLRSIEQTFIELQNVPLQQISHQNQAGFVTPIVNPVLATSVASLSNSTSSSVSPPPSAYQSLSGRTGTSSSSSSGNESPLWSVGSPSQVVVKKAPTRNMGGRRPTKNEKLTPEEEERRRMRRERNKLAAARCRKRRLDHTNCLIQETDCLEEKRLSLQNEIQELQTQRDELEFILDAHKVVCKLQKHNHNGHRNHSIHQDAEDVKPILSDITPLTAVSTCASSACTNSVSSSITISTRDTSLGDNSHTRNNRHPPYSVQPKRPTTLPVLSHLSQRPPVSSSSSMTSHSGNTMKTSLVEETGIAISTPSSGIFNYEALMEGGTGLTPVTCSPGLISKAPSCSKQNHSSSNDLSSPDMITPTKLISL